MRAFVPRSTAFCAQVPQDEHVLTTGDNTAGRCRHYAGARPVFALLLHAVKSSPTVIQMGLASKKFRHQKQ
jgi:hypothetical protein